MANFIFNEDENLGKVVETYEVFCSWSPSKPIGNLTQVTSDVCGHKFSKLCGFNFKSKMQVQYPIFQIVYCPKTRSNYVRNDRGLHGWYIWQHHSADDKTILSIHDLMALYNFDLSKFFQSDLFQKYLPLFRKQVVKSYTSQVLPYIDQITGDQEVILPGGIRSTYSKKTAEFLARCAFDSVQKIGDVLKIDLEKPDMKKAKVAYNADKTYSLNMRNTLNTWDGSGDHKASKMNDSEKINEMNHGFQDYDFNTVNDFDLFFSAVSQENQLDNGLQYDKKDTEHVVFRDKNGKELKVISAQVLNNGINFILD